MGGAASPEAPPSLYTHPRGQRQWQPPLERCAEMHRTLSAQGTNQITAQMHTFRV